MGASRQPLCDHPTVTLTTVSAPSRSLWASLPSSGPSPTARASIPETGRSPAASSPPTLSFSASRVSSTTQASSTLDSSFSPTTSTSTLGRTCRTFTSRLPQTPPAQLSAPQLTVALPRRLAQAATQPLPTRRSARLATLVQPRAAASYPLSRPSLASSPLWPLPLQPRSKAF